MTDKDDANDEIKPNTIERKTEKSILERLATIEGDCSIMGFVRLPALVKLLGVSKTTIYKEIRAGRFPKHVRISPRTSAWRISDLQTHFDNIDSRPAE